jgi:hypothetical protein
VATLDANLSAGNEALAAITHDRDGRPEEEGRFPLPAVAVADSAVGSSTVATAALSKRDQVASLSSRARRLISDNDADVSDASAKLNSSTVTGTLTAHFVVTAREEIANATSSFARAEKARAEGDPSAYNDYLNAISAATQAKAYAAAARHTGRAAASASSEASKAILAGKRNDTESVVSTSTAQASWKKDGRTEDGMPSWSAAVMATSTPAQPAGKEKSGDSHRED